MAVSKPEARFSVAPRIDADATVRAIAEVLGKQRRVRTLQADLDFEARSITDLLSDWGVSEAAVRMALGLIYTKGGYARGTQHTPNARRLDYGVEAEGQVVRVRDAEVYARAAYLANAAKRMSRAMDAGATQREAIRREAVYYRQHEKARRGRLDAAAQVEYAGGHYGIADERGTLLGWHINPLLNNDPECVAANGHNFYAEEGTVIGLPGSVHANCGCYAGPVWEGATLVNEAVSNLVVMRRTRPTFKLKTGKRRTA